MKTVHATSFADFVTFSPTGAIQPAQGPGPGPRSRPGPGSLPMLPQPGWERHLTDLRRVSPAKIRDTILHRASFLPEADRALITAHFAVGQSIRALALASGTSKNTLTRRKRAILNRLLHPAFLVVLYLGPTWPCQHAAAARGIFIEGRSMRAISRSQRMGYAAVRVIRNMVEALVAKLLAEGRQLRVGA